VYPGLGALHTLFMRYHNYVAESLAALNTDWDDEETFQQTRKIIIAILQRITYSEYMPGTIGSDNMATYGVSDDYVYDDSCDPTLYNVFATAAFRFGHSQVPDGLVVDGTTIVESKDLFGRPKYVLNDLDNLVDGLVSNQAENTDRWYSSGMTNHLFEDADVGTGSGLDIAALNIQRGRDHGLPGYNDWRQYCGFDPIDFEDLAQGASNRFASVYASADDIDLYSGGLVEASAGGQTGETYACLLGKQFRNLRSCDRFWWENEDTTVGFSSNRQRGQIKKVKLSHIICQVTGITSIQERVMSIVEDSNPETTCEALLSDTIDLSLWGPQVTRGPGRQSGNRVRGPSG